MKKAIFLAAVAALFATAATQRATAQQQMYSYSVARTHTTMLIDWRPEVKTQQRYTVSVSPLRLVSSGLKFDFEYELPKPGHWLGTSLVMYLAPPREERYWNNDGNNHSSFYSGWDDFNRMWGIGTSVFFKNTFSRHGWYFSTGIVFEYFSVGVNNRDYIPYAENGLTFYDYGKTRETKSYFKPTAQINLGKHFAITERCYFDIYAGVGISHSFYKDNGKHDSLDGSYYPRFSDMSGFGYRGLSPIGGFRFGMLLWDR